MKIRMANSEDPDEMAHNKPSHLNLHCLHSTDLKVLDNIELFDDIGEYCPELEYQRSRA